MADSPFRGRLPRATTPKARRSVARILDAAARIFSRRGYSGASMGQVAKEAGVSKGLLHYHFESKEHLLIEAQRAVLRQIHKRFLERAKAGDRGLQAAVDALDALWEALLDFRAQAPFMVETFSLASQEGGVRDAIDAFAAGNAWLVVLALVGIVLIVRGYADARLDPTLLYTTPVWMRHLAALLLLPVFILFFAPYLPGRIKTATKHPQLIAVKLWAVSHLLVNGMLADVILFGAFLAWAVADRISLKRRTPRGLPVEIPASGINDVILVILGLVTYVVFAMWLHTMLIGVAPFG